MPRRNKLRHPWLDANDPANTARGQSLPGFWVPTPAEIETACEQLNKLVGNDGADERRSFRVLKTFKVSEQREQIEEESQLCDCPYWGTEFKE